MVMNWMKSLFSVKRAGHPTPIAPGLYHAQQAADGMYTRFHLRVELDGTGMLIANAAAAARLTPSGVVIAQGLLAGTAQAEILATLKRSFHGATDAVMQQDIAKVQALIAQIVAPGDMYPVFNLEDASVSPYAAQLIAPLQASVPLANPMLLVPLIDRLWDVGIPHITLLAPPQPEAAYLIRAVERAEDLGMIAGVRGRAVDLYTGTLLSDLAQAGVDYITYIYASNDAALHDALCGETPSDHAAAVELLRWLEENEVCAVAEIPLLKSTLDDLDETVATLMAQGVDNLSLVAYASTDAAIAEQGDIFLAEAMPQVATIVEEVTEEANARFIWNPPVQREPTQSLTAQVQAGPRCSGDVAVRVEPDGRVIPARGPRQSAGNLLTQPWDAIWEHDVFRIYRERVEAPTRCDICPGLTICAADCPKEPKGWSQG